MTATNGLPGGTTGELGVTGLNVQMGRPQEEPLRQLQGDKWRDVLAEMIHDPMVAAVLFATEQLIRQVGWQTIPASDAPEDEEQAEFVEQARGDTSHSWQDFLAECLSFVPWGWSYFEIVYKLRGGDTDEPTTRSRFDDGRIGWRKWSIRAQESLDHWEFDGDGGVQAMVQRTPDWRFVGIPIQKALLFRTTSRKNNPEGVSALRGAYQPWYYKTNIQRIEGVGVERDLAGLPVLWGPPELFSPTATAEQKAVFELLRKIATNIKRDEQEGLVMPLAYDDKHGHKLYDVQLLSTGGTRQFDTDKIIQRYDLRIAMTMLADFILLGSRQVGSYALSSDKTNLFAVALGAWLDGICEVINTHAIPRLLRLNGLRPANGYPTVQHGDVERVDWAVFGEALMKLTAAGLELTSEDWQWLRERLGMPIPSEEAMAEQERLRREREAQEAEAVAAAAAARGGQNGGGGGGAGGGGPSGGGEED